jgi:hypothetical protein
MLSKPLAYASTQRCFSGTIAHAPVFNYQMMLMSNTGLDFRSVWMSLSALNKSFVLFFCGASLYTFSISLHALVVLYSAKRQSSKEITSDAGPPLGILLHRFANLRQLHLFTLYLFGFCIAMQVPSVFHTIDNSKEYPFNVIMRGLTFLFYFDAVVFLGFLLLHTVQWIVSARLDSFSTRQG